MTPFTLDQHLADDLIVRILDGEASGPEYPQTKLHLDGCEVCAERLHELRHRSRALTALLEASDPPMPAMRLPSAGRRPVRGWTERRTWLRAAAVLLLFAGVGIIASPARAWILDWVRDALDGWSEPVSRAEPAASGDAGSIAFEPVGSEVLVHVVDASGGGRLRLRSHGDPSLVIQASDSDAASDVLLLPAGVRIQRTTERVTYEIALPPSIELLRLQLGDAAPIPLESARLPCVITLGSAPPAPACAAP